MPQKAHFTMDEALAIAQELGVDFGEERFTPEDLREGLDVELEHGLRSPETDVTHDDPVLTGKIALAHLREMPDYYRRLAAMEAEAEAQPPGETPPPA
ncbi:MAG TPA: DUF5661 family protein [Actinomycetota bacterium]